MPTGINRRRTLILLGGSACFVNALATHTPQHLAAAWQAEDGSYHIGILAAAPVTDAPLSIVHALDIPTRAHGLLPLPDGSLVAVARRPGDWLLRWLPGSRQKPVWHWTDGTRTFNGHAIARGNHIYCTETDTDSETSLVVRRHAQTLETDAEWPTHGIDAHELLWDGAHLIVANGGVPTAPETGRSKRDLHRMQSTLVRLNGRTGALQGQWSLPDPRLSLRHLAWNPQHTALGIALQAEHDDTAAQHAAPVLALWDGQRLRVCSHVAVSLHGYGGSIAATPHGWAVSCPRAGGIAHFTLQGAWHGLVPLPEACALAVSEETGLWAGGREASLQGTLTTPAQHPHAASLQGVRLDNHWAAWVQHFP